MCTATGWTFEYVWFELDYDIAVKLLNWMPNHWYKVHASMARLGFAFESFAGAKHASYVEWLEPWMRPDAGDSGPTETVFSPAVAADVDLAFDLGYLSQAALVALGPKRLRAAGAFHPKRSTDVTIGG